MPLHEYNYRGCALRVMGSYAKHINSYATGTKREKTYPVSAMRDLKHAKDKSRLVLTALHYLN